MAKRQYNSRLEPECIDNLQGIAAEHGVSSAETLEALVFWLAGNDRALANCSLALREAISVRAGQPVVMAPAPSADVEDAISVALGPVLERLARVESELKKGTAIAV
jgi:hypothetical protein